MTTLQNFPLVSQRSTVTSDGRPSENALYDCVPASIGAIMLWLEGKSAWDSLINPDHLKDVAYGEAYSNAGTSATQYVTICKSLGFNLSSIDTPDAASTVNEARNLLVQNKAVIFTMLDPYVDTSLPQYAGWTHVCVFIGADATGLTAMDPFIAQPVYKSDGTWASLLRANQVWTVERIPTLTVPAGWKDDGHTLIAPNGHYCRDGFRLKVLAGNWDPANVPLQEEQGLNPLEGSNPSLGAGTRLVFAWTVLEWTQIRGVFVAWGGQELLWREGVYNALYAEYQKVKAQLAQMQGGAALLTDMQSIKGIAVKY